MSFHRLLGASSIALALLAGCGSGTKGGGTTTTDGGAVSARSEIASTVANVTVPLAAGWNGVGFRSQQVALVNPPAAITGMAFFDGTAYQTRNFTSADVNLAGGGRRGFWVLANQATSFTYSGTDTGANFVDLTPGYNLVSFATDQDIPGSSVTASQNGQAVPLSSVVLPIFSEIQPPATYVSVDVTTGTLRAGRAYWVFANQAVRLNLPPNPSPSPGVSPGGSPAASPVGQVTSITVAPANSTLPKNQTGQFTASAQLANGSTVNVTNEATWSSDAPSVAASLGQGQFKGLNMGSCNITATLSGSSGSTRLTVTDLAGPGPVPSPSPGVPVFWTLSGVNDLVELNQADGSVRSTGPVAGPGAYTLSALAVRPSTGVLYGLGFNFAAVLAEGRLFTIDVTTRVGTLVGTFQMPNSIGSSLSAATSFGMAFIPTTDEIRVISSGRDNFRLNPTTAVVTTDTILNTGMMGSIYTNQLAGATSTTEYTLESASNQLFLVGGNPVPPGLSSNNGLAAPVGPLGVDFNDVVGFTVDRNGVASASLTVGGVAGLYRINLATGAATLQYALPVGVTGRALEAAVR